MALYFVRWYDPARQATLRRDFHSKPAAARFRERLPLLSEPPALDSERRRPVASKPQVTWGPAR